MRGAAASVQCPRCGESAPPFSATGAFVHCQKCGLSFDPDPDRVVAPRDASEALVAAPPGRIQVHVDTEQALRLSWPYKDAGLIFGLSLVMLALFAAAKLFGDEAPYAPLVLAAFIVIAVGFPITLFQRKTMTIAEGILEVTRRIPSASTITLTLSQIASVSTKRLETRKGRVSYGVLLELRDTDDLMLTELYDPDEAEYVAARITERLPSKD